MAASTQSVAKHSLAVAGSVMAAALIWTFAAPDRNDTPALPVPRPTIAELPLRAAAKPDRHARTRDCSGATGGPVSHPRPITDPQSWFTDDDYPAFALFANRQGMTMAELVVDQEGKVAGCGVAASSGHFSLHTKTCAVFRQRARFEPAIDDRGCPVAGVWRRRVLWVIPRD